jgi:TRAP transporter TAXI family solute receptor
MGWPARKWGFAVLAALASAAVAPAPGAQEGMRHFRIATGPTAGTYFPIGALIAGIISGPEGGPACEDGGGCGVPDLIAVAQATDGSVANLAAIAAGRFDSALAQADIVHWAYSGAGPMLGQGENTALRAIANLYPESVHLVARRGSGIAAVADLKGRRVSLDTAGSGTRADADLILAAFGLAEDDIQPIYASLGRAIEMIETGEIDALFFVGGYPAQGVSALASQDLISLVPIDGPPAQALRESHPFFSPDRIPDDAYAGVGGVETLSVAAQWVVAASESEELIYAITAALWHPLNRRHLDGGHAKARLIRPETALSGITIPLHPGAARFYGELGKTR